MVNTLGQGEIRVRVKLGLGWNKGPWLNVQLELGWKLRLRRNRNHHNRRISRGLRFYFWYLHWSSKSTSSSFSGIIFLYDNPSSDGVNFHRFPTSLATFFELVFLVIVYNRFWNDDSERRVVKLTPYKETNLSSKPAQISIQILLFYTER